jgi:hypothetical protein
MGRPDVARRRTTTKLVPSGIFNVTSGWLTIFIGTSNETPSGNGPPRNKDPAK